MPRKNRALIQFRRFVTKRDGVDPGDLACDFWAWKAITADHVAAFVQYYSFGHPETMRGPLAQIRVHAALAYGLKAISQEQLETLCSVTEDTPAPGPGEHQANRLKTKPDTSTPEGRRDALMFALVLDHDLHVREIAGLTPINFDLAAGQVWLYRLSGEVEVITLSPDALRAARAYLENDAPQVGRLFEDSREEKAKEVAQRIGNRVRTL